MTQAWLGKAPRAPLEAQSRSTREPPPLSREGSTGPQRQRCTHLSQNGCLSLSLSLFSLLSLREGSRFTQPRASLLGWKPSRDRRSTCGHTCRTKCSELTVDVATPAGQEQTRLGQRLLAVFLVLGPSVACVAQAESPWCSDCNKLRRLATE